MIKVHQDLWRRLEDQTYALATYLLDTEPAPVDEDEAYRDPIERAAEHVAKLAGYQGSDAVYVADVLYCFVRNRCGHAPSRAPVDQAPEWTS